jgi:hypothetical protein
VHELFDGLVRELPLTDRALLAKQLIILYDGAVATAQMDSTSEPARTARAMAQLLIQPASALPAS